MFVVGFTVTAAVVAWPRWVTARNQTIALADAHRRYQVAHPGWSFPAHVWSAPAELDALPAQRIVAHARLRGYTEACPPTQPGEFCADDGAVIPRGGHFAEGVQPPGTENWTRPLALEPVLIGTLVGPDGELRTHLPLAEAPPRLVAAIVTSEDTDFWHHHGVNLRGILRAALFNARGGGFQQGASTLTMQVVRNLSQDKRKTLARKAREAVSALALDRYWGKQGVLQAYLDAPYLGQDGSQSVCGFQAAAWYYWGIDARDLTLAQAATLASILPAPGRFDPIRHTALARERRDRVLQKMLESGWDAAEVLEALAEPVAASAHAPPPPLHPAYLQATRAWLEQHLDPQVLYGAGLDVFTALDLVAQDRSEATIPERLPFLQQAVGRQHDDPLQAAGVVIDVRTGLLAAAYGGTQALATDFNRATQAKRQSGSSIKPLIYAMAFADEGEGGLPAWSARDTVPNHLRTFPNTNGWRPHNAGGKYSETATLAWGLAWSQNIATASLLEELGGPVRLKRFARKLDFDTRDWPDEMGLALGQGEVTPLEMARLAATIANEGRLASGRPVITALDPAGQVRVPPPPAREQVMTPTAAALTRELMRLVITYGTGGATRGTAGIPGYTGPAIGKTGTTDSEKDLWFIGATPSYAAAIWLGYDQPHRIGASASDLAAPLWGWWMRAVHEGLPMDDFSGMKIRHYGVCRETGLWGNETCTLIGAPLLDGTKPHGTCPIQHPPPDPDKKYESLWKRRAREQAEAEAAAAAEEQSDGATQTGTE